MKITPFVPQAAFFGSTLSWILLAFIVVGIGLTIFSVIRMETNQEMQEGIPVASNNKTGMFMGFMTGGVIVAALSSAFLFSGGPQMLQNEDAYNLQMEQANSELSAAGFNIVSGELNLYPDTQSLLLLEYRGTNYDCTEFSPADTSKTIVFSCGAAKQTLSEVIASNK